jgi:hypothetical protein
VVPDVREPAVPDDVVPRLRRQLGMLE